jgi:hypothetical protein
MKFLITAIAIKGNPAQKDTPKNHPNPAPFLTDILNGLRISDANILSSGEEHLFVATILIIHTKRNIL